MVAYVAYLDCHAGITGELLLAALLDAGFPLAELKRGLVALPIEGYELKHTSVEYRGVRGSYLDIIVSPSVQAPRSLDGIMAILQSSFLSMHIQETSLAIMRHLEMTSSSIAGSPAGDVFLSEEEALKALICVVGVVLGLASLSITQLYASPLPLTGGMIATAQGFQPVPADLTLDILRRVAAPWQPSLLEGERVTALGAALLASLARFERPIIAISSMSCACEPASANTRYARLYAGSLQTESAIGDEDERVEDADTDQVAVVETHIDTMTGELLGGLMERLFTLGALDVSYTPIQMKKNRPASLLTVICPAEQSERFALVLLRETSTLGVRIQHVRRLKAQREQRSIVTDFGPVVVKVKRLGARVISAAPEYEECQRIARAANIPLAVVYDRVQQAIRETIIGREES